MGILFPKFLKPVPVRDANTEIGLLEVCYPLLKENQTTNKRDRILVFVARLGEGIQDFQGCGVRLTTRIPRLGDLKRSEPSRFTMAVGTACDCLVFTFGYC